MVAFSTLRIKTSSFCSACSTFKRTLKFFSSFTCGSRVTVLLEPEVCLLENTTSVAFSILRFCHCQWQSVIVQGNTVLAVLALYS